MHEKRSALQATIIELVAHLFEIREGQTYRIGTTKPLEGNKPDSTSGRIRVSVRPYGHVLLHRLKFYLAHGWEPELIDHKDGDYLNNSLGNLRPATVGQNNQNKVAKKGKHPRGVTLHQGRYRARVWMDGKPCDLGSYDTPEQASLRVEANLKELHGEFYREQGHTQNVDQRQRA